LKVTVEGNIGSGKSTFLHYFRQSEKVEVILISIYNFNILPVLEEHRLITK